MSPPAVFTGDGLRLAAAGTIGAHRTIDVQTEDAVEVVRELTEGRMADVVLDLTPSIASVPLALDLVRFRGRVLLAGLKKFAPAEGLVTDKIVLQGLKVFGGAGFAPESMRRAVQLISERTVDTVAVRGETFELARVDEAMALLTRTGTDRDAVRVSLTHAW